MAFENRIAAGKALAAELKKREYVDVLVLGIPRGGVVVGKVVKDELGGELGIIVTKKIGFPGNPEYGIGAVAEDGTIVLSEAGKKNKSVTEEYLQKESEKQRAEIKRRQGSYGYHLPEDLSSQTVIVVDDGIATGMTVIAALRFLRNKNPKRLILAVPVAPADIIEKLKDEADEVICLTVPRFFYAVGQFYRDFSQVEDDEVVDNLKGN
jgi:putative phosphoribosyl transferase